MIIYEITATVNSDLIEDYESFMIDRHIPDLIETGHFGSAEISRSQPGRYRMRYAAKDKEALENYLRTDASRLREDFVRHFPDGVQILRENWEMMHSW